jgi:hypothetical protein
MGVMTHLEIPIDTHNDDLRSTTFKQKNGAVGRKQHRSFRATACSPIVSGQQPALFSAEMGELA